ncbi:Equilibrative nucleoside transporter 1 [Bagarius yarrelli]|uniref:Equilibrative nucleoside transporter 1 n=1 Tax=Bagarius yarrelli TaxID=175774 RepID=A0A556VAD8_BAGYA|nr:Equilibrative nucleoside transporter 1 [Bagarius yarrelli]
MPRADPGALTEDRRRGEEKTENTERQKRQSCAQNSGTSEQNVAFKAVWLILFTLGLGTLLPWNFFMTATMYFNRRLADPTPANITVETQNPMQAKFNNSMTLCAMIPLLIFTCLTSMLHQSLFGMAGMLPDGYTTPIMSGQGLAGTFAALAMICAIASTTKQKQTAQLKILTLLLTQIFSSTGGSDLMDCAFGYFITACVVISIAILSYIILPKLPGKDCKSLPALLFARLLFVPLFMLCNVQPRSSIPVYFTHDAWFIVFIILFAFSSGYLASLCMCFYPKLVDTQEAETAGAIMTFFMSVGLASGATLSFLFRGVI